MRKLALLALLVCGPAYAGGYTDEGNDQAQLQGQGQLQGQLQGQGQHQSNHAGAFSAAGAASHSAAGALALGAGGEANAGAYGQGGAGGEAYGGHALGAGGAGGEGYGGEGGTGEGGSATGGAASANGAPQTLTSSPTTNTNITTKNRSLMANLSMAPVNISDCMTASHVGGFGNEGGALIQWAGINKSCFAQKMAEAEDDLHTAVMLKCSIPTYRDAVAYEISPAGAVTKVRGNKQVHCIERELSIANDLLAQTREYVDDALAAGLVQMREDMVTENAYDDSELRRRLGVLEEVAHAPNSTFLLKE